MEHLETVEWQRQREDECLSWCFQTESVWAQRKSGFTSFSGKLHRFLLMWRSLGSSQAAAPFNESADFVQTWSRKVINEPWLLKITDGFSQSDRPDGHMRRSSRHAGRTVLLLGWISAHYSSELFQMSVGFEWDYFNSGTNQRSRLRFLSL